MFQAVKKHHVGPTVIETPRLSKSSWTSLIAKLGNQEKKERWMECWMNVSLRKNIESIFWYICYHMLQNCLRRIFSHGFTAEQNMEDDLEVRTKDRRGDVPFGP